MAGDEKFMDKMSSEIDWKIDTDSEFKKFDKLINKDWWEEAFEEEVDSKGAAILDSFWAGLDQKIQAALTGLNSEWKSVKMKERVRSAYLVLWKLKEGWATAAAAKLNGRKWLYKEMKDAAEQVAALNKKYQEMVKMIDKDKTLSFNSKNAAKTCLKAIFDECKTVEEFERRAWSTLDGINSMDNVKDVIKKSITTANETLRRVSTLPSELEYELLRQCNATKKEMENFLKQELEAGRIKINQFVDWSKEQWERISDITKAVIESWKESFREYLNYLEGVKEWLEEALNTAYEYCWNKWDAFVDLCGWARDSVIAFWKELVEKWKLAWQDLVDGLKQDWEKWSKVVLEFYNEWKIKMGELVEWCNWMWVKGKELLLNLLESSKNAFNQFTEWCKDNWESAQETFKQVTTELIAAWKIKVEEFLDACKKDWEKMKKTASEVLVWLVKIWKVTVEAACTCLLAVVWVGVIACELLIEAGKGIYWKGKELAKFASDVAINVLGKTKDAYKSATEFLSSVLNKCKEIWLTSAEFVKDFLSRSWEKMKELWVSAQDFIRATYESAKLSLKDSWNATAAFFQELWMEVSEVVTTLYTEAKWAWRSCADFVAAVVESGKLAFNSAIDLLINKCKMGIDQIGKAFMKCKNKATEFIKYAKRKWLVTLENIRKWCDNEYKQIKNFIDTAITKCGAKWDDLVKWCDWKVDQLKAVLNDIYWASKEKAKQFLQFVADSWKTMVEAWKFMIELWIGTVALAIIGLKELWVQLADTVKVCVETLVKQSKLQVQALCDSLAEAYWDSKEWCIKIWKEVAKSISDTADSVREWIYEKTKDAKKAYEAMRNYIKEWAKDVFVWLYRKGIAIKDICNALRESFGNSLKSALEWVRAAAKECKIEIWTLVRDTWNWIIDA